MILADFTQLQQQRDSNKNNKKIKNTHNQNLPHAQSTINESRKSSNINNSRMHDAPISTQKNVYSYMNELDIGNLQEFYNKQGEEKRKQQIRKNKQVKQKHLQQSIQRLYCTGLSKTVNKIIPQNTNTQINSSQKQNNPNQHPQYSPKHYYNQLYPQQQGFDHKFRLKMVETECDKMRQKLFSRFINKYAIWVAENQNDLAVKLAIQMTLKASHPHAKSQIVLEHVVTERFLRSLLAFVLSVQITTHIDTHQRLFSLYSDYINKYKLKHWQKQLQNKQFDRKTYDKLKLLAHSLPFVYWLSDFTCLQKIEQVQFRNINDLYKWIHSRYDKSRQWERIYEVFRDKLNPKFTVPFETRLYQVRKVHQVNEVDHSDEEQTKRQPIKANPIPSSTYNKPKQHITSQKKQPTQAQPFNFTQTHQNIAKLTSDQLYSWNRNFKAKPVPKTNYQPQLININEKEKQWNKKAHIDKIYQQSSFPKTMAYLQNYDEFQQFRQKQLAQKHTKNHQHNNTKSKPVPDFQKIHRQQQYILEKRKQINRTNTQPKPFNFTQTKKSDMKNQLKSTLILDQQLQHEQKKKSKKITQHTIMPEARSTAKFDAYITMRKQEKQEKKAYTKEKQQQKKRKEEDMKMYKQILKQRVQNELLNQPKAIQYNNNNQGNNQNVVKVDLENIYLEKPLLMSGTQGKNNGKRNTQDDQRTCYTDGFQPII